MLGIRDDSREHLFAQQYNADDGKDMGGLAPYKGVCVDKPVDGIYRPVQYDSIDLRYERADEGVFGNFVI